VAAESPGPGRGATFTITLPVSPGSNSGWKPGAIDLPA
jgi:hypothetical protein